MDFGNQRRQWMHCLDMFDGAIADSHGQPLVTLDCLLLLALCQRENRRKIIQSPTLFIFATLQTGQWDQ